MKSTTITGAPGWLAWHPLNRSTPPSTRTFNCVVRELMQEQSCRERIPAYINFPIRDIRGIRVP